MQDISLVSRKQQFVTKPDNRWWERLILQTTSGNSWSSATEYWGNCYGIPERKNWVHNRDMGISRHALKFFLANINFSTFIILLNILYTSSILNVRFILIITIFYLSKRTLHCIVSCFVQLKILFPSSKICYERDFSFEMSHQNCIDQLITRWSFGMACCCTSFQRWEMVMRH